MDRRNDYLAHYGVKGQKWGIRRYQNKDGTLTAAGKKHVNDYRTKQEMRKKVDDEGNKLIRQNKQLSRDVGGKHQNVDDEEFFELTARDYGLNTDLYWSAYTSYTKFCRENRESIKNGEKIVKKLLKE